MFTEENVAGSPLDRIEGSRRLDSLGRLIAPLARRLGSGRIGQVLHGDWMGHPLHPALTDLPIGFWTSSFLLDMAGGRRSRKAAQRLIGAGLLAVVPTAAAGAADWASIHDDGPRRVGVAHVLGNSVATLLYAWSWTSRRRGRHAMGVAVGVAAATAATVGGYLGGHLAFGSSAASEDRGSSGAAADDSDTSSQLADATSSI